MGEVESEFRLMYTNSEQVNNQLRKESDSKDAEIQSLKKQTDELLIQRKKSDELHQSNTIIKDKEIQRLTKELSEVKVSRRLMAMKLEMKNAKLNDSEKLCKLYESQNEQLQSFLSEKNHDNNPLLELANQEARYKDDIICKQNSTVKTQMLRIKFLSKLSLKADQKIKDNQKKIEKLESSITNLQQELTEYEKAFSSFNRYFKVIQVRDSQAKQHVMNLHTHFNNIKQKAFLKVFNKRHSLSCESIDIVNKLANVFNLSSDEK